MLTVRQLVLLTNNFKRSILEKATSVSVRFVSIKTDTDEDGDEFREVLCICKGDTISRHVAFRFYGKGPEAHVWCSCDCPWFLYNSEVAVQRKGSTDILFSNGRWPRVTNPRGTPNLCKHQIAALAHGAANKMPPKPKPVKPAPKKKEEKSKDKPKPQKAITPTTQAPKNRMGRMGRRS